MPEDRYLAGLARWIGSGGLASVQLLIGWWIWQLSVAFEARKKTKENNSSRDYVFVLGPFIRIYFVIGFSY